jgi:glycosyltransferase involved in cell wall biosynthesis
MTRIAMLIPTIDQIGGAERQILLLSKELSIRGWQVTIIALSGEGAACADDLRCAGVSYLSLQMRKAWIDPRGWLRYLQWLSCNHPDILHAHLPHATWFARWVRPLAPVRVLVDTIHTSSTGTVARQLAYRLTNSRTDSVTCVSKSVAAAAIAARMVPQQNLTILPNGIDMPPPTSTPRPNRFNSSEIQPFRWIAVGRLTAVKDYPTLLRAFAKLSGEPTLQIAGSGPEEHSLRNLASELGIRGRVQFTGFQRDVRPLLVAADAFVLSSLWEGLPMSVLEAAAAGLPTVATDGKGTCEAMRPGETGFVVPVGDVAALSEAMTRMMAMPIDERLKMGESGRHFVKEQFSLPVVVDQWQNLYAQLLEENPHPSRHGHGRGHLL